MKISCFVFTLLATLQTVAQSISGQVVDAQTKQVLPYVNVYLSNTTKGIQTDEKGNFRLTGLLSGYVKVVASMLGYESFVKEILLQPDKTQIINIVLKPDNRLLNEVKVVGKKDKQWQTNYKKFQRVFLGYTLNAKKTKVLNPYDIDIQIDKQQIAAQAIKNIEIENLALGYTLSYQLTAFLANSSAYSFLGNLRFMPLAATDINEANGWAINRQRSYAGSLRHFLTSVVERRSQQEGFKVYVENIPQKNINRQRFFDDNALTEINPDTLARFNPALQEATLPVQRYEVHYLKHTDKEHWYFDLKNDVSWLEFSGERFAFSYNGIMADSRQIQLTGSMSKHRIADALPDDYQPTSISDDVPSQETSLARETYDKAYLSLNDVFFLRRDTLTY